MCFGPFARLLHWGPLTAVSIIKLVTGMTLHCSGMWWPVTDLPSLLNTVCFLSLSGLTLYNFLSSMTNGPGYLPLKWKPQKKEEEKFLQWCSVCQGYKAPRTHHCRKCGRCVCKMDHHCPWINNCVGWANHAHFVFFLSFATLGCSHAAVILSFSVYHSFFRTYYLYYGLPKPIIYLGLLGKIMTITALGFAIGVVIAVGLLLFFQIRGIMRNRTGIEDWIYEKAEFRAKSNQEKFVYPYDIGVSRNILEVINLQCQPKGDGIEWPVVEGCDQYTLTREQILQKKDKRSRTKIYTIIEPASGHWFPITKGIKTCLQFPCTDEKRIKLDVGDAVLVTRWRKHWLFGEKVQKHLSEEEGSVNRVRGWFPRSCAKEMADESVNSSHSASHSKKRK